MKIIFGLEKIPALEKEINSTLADACCGSGFFVSEEFSVFEKNGVQIRIKITKEPDDLELPVYSAVDGVIKERAK